MKEQKILIYGSSLLTCISYYLGGYDKSLLTLIIIIALDLITGIMSAAYNKNLNSKIGLKGFLKKFGYLIAICLANLIGNIMNDNGAIRTLIIYYLIGIDGISILENLGKMNVKLPKKLVEVLEQLKGNEE